MTGTFQILRLKTFTSPSASAGTVVAKGAADAIIIAGTGEEGVDFLYSRLGAAQPQLQSPTHGWQQIVALQLFPDRFAVELLQDAAVLTHPRQQPRHLGDRGDGAVGDRGDLRVDLGSGRLGNRARSRGKGAIDVEPTGIDCVVQRPQLPVRWAAAAAVADTARARPPRPGAQYVIEAVKSFLIFKPIVTFKGSSSL